jgi:rod shape determining protein RodA
VRAGNIQGLDLPLVLCTLAALAMGVIIVFSATNGDKDYAIRQAGFGIIGLVLMFGVSRLDYRFLESFTVPIYLLTLALLGVVLVIGHVSNGSQRWINLGFFPLQPSELAKLMLIVVLAKLLSTHKEELRKPRWFLAAAIVTGVPMVLVFEQPDLGTALMLGAIFIGLTVAAGVPLRTYITAALLAIPAIYFFWTYFMHDYQRERLTIFLDPAKDPTASGYNIIQSRIAIGSGGWFGEGYMAGHQTQGEFLKVRYSDFIFSVIGEEFGLIGSLAICALLFILVLRCLAVANRSQDDFACLLAVGVATWIGVQIFVNVGMNIGLMPVTGIPLPFISYGGSALISMFLGLGLVQSVSLRSSPIIFGGNPWSRTWLKWARTSVRNW